MIFHEFSSNFEEFPLNSYRKFSYKGNFDPRRGPGGVQGGGAPPGEYLIRWSIILPVHSTFLSMFCTFSFFLLYFASGSNLHLFYLKVLYENVQRG